MSQIHIFVLNHTAITDLGVNHVLSRCGTGSLALFCLLAMCGGRDREELGRGRRRDQRRRRQRPDRGGEGGGRTVQFDEDKRVVPRVTVAILCGRKEATEKAASSKRIVFIVSP